MQDMLHCCTHLLLHHLLLHHPLQPQLQEEGLAHGGEGGGDGGLAVGDDVEGAADGRDRELGRDHRPHHPRRPGSHPLRGLKHPGMIIW